MVGKQGGQLKNKKPDNQMTIRLLCIIKNVFINVVLLHAIRILFYFDLPTTNGLP